MKPEWKTKLFLVFLLFSYNTMFSYSMKSWDYIKGGADWPEDCKKGNQAPLDISQPFTFKSK